MKQIILTQGKTALVDEEDFIYLSQFKWKASHIGKNWYAMREEYLGTVQGKKMKKAVYMHRLIAERSGIDTSNLIDHIDQNSLNNCRNNLRSATHKQNKENITVYNHNTSGHRGVSKTWNDKWRARIKHNQKDIHLGVFEDFDNAVKARLEAEKKYFTHSEVCG